MISVKKDYNDIPAILESEEVENFREAWKRIYYSDQGEFIEPKVNRKIYTDESVVNALNEIYHNKCAMCEVKLFEKQNVAHYRPITLYPWLAYEWSNLFLLCHDCDKAKGEFFPTLGEEYKVTKPPMSFYDWRATSNIFIGEISLLLNPEIAYSENYFDLKMSGSFESQDKIRQTTIRRYSLNRKNLINARKKIIDRYLSLFESKFSQFLKNDFQKLEPKKLPALMNEYFYNFFNELILFKRDDAEFSFVHKFIYENFVDFLSGISEILNHKDMLGIIYNYFVNGSSDINSILHLRKLQIESQMKKIEEVNKNTIENRKSVRLQFISDTKLDSIEIKNFHSINKIDTIKNLKDKNEIYFLGENGDGKTLLLQGILIALRQKAIMLHMSSAIVGKVLDILDPKESSENKLKSIFYAIDNLGNKFGKEFDIDYKAIFAYGVNRSRNDSDKKDESGFMTLFDSERYLNSPIKWLQYLHSKDLEKTANIYTTDTITLPVAKEILENLLGEGKDLEIEVSADAVSFQEKGSNTIQFDQLSEGYKSVMTWVCDLLYRLAMNQPEVKPEKNSDGKMFLGYKAIVLVDEIDLHLHPKWANKIVSKLRTWFPNIQFFFTTHSPIVLLGASREAVFYKVYKEDGVTKISQPLESISSLTANTILTSPLFGLEDAISDAYDAGKDEPDTEDDFLYTVIHRQIKEKVKQIAGVTEKDIMKLVNEELDKLEIKEN